MTRTQKLCVEMRGAKTMYFISVIKISLLTVSVRAKFIFGRQGSTIKRFFLVTVFHLFARNRLTCKRRYLFNEGGMMST